MPDLTVLDLQARELAPAVPTRAVDHALNVFSRAVFSLALAFAGFVVATVLLLAGVIGAPIIASVLAAVALRRRGASRADVYATTG